MHCVAVKSVPACFNDDQCMNRVKNATYEMPLAKPLIKLTTKTEIRDICGKRARNHQKNKLNAAIELEKTATFFALNARVSHPPIMPPTTIVVEAATPVTLPTSINEKPLSIKKGPVMVEVRVFEK